MTGDFTGRGPLPVGKDSSPVRAHSVPERDRSRMAKWPRVALTVAVVAVVAAALVGAYFLVLRPADSPPVTCCVPALVELGPITNDSSGTSAAYGLTIAGGNSAISLTSYSFNVVLPGGTAASIASVCVASSSGAAKGTWVSGSWSTHETSAQCSASASFPPESGAWIATGDILYYYFASSVVGGLPMGSGFQVSVSGPQGGTIGESLGS